MLAWVVRCHLVYSGDIVQARGVHTQHPKMSNSGQHAGLHQVGTTRADKLDYLLLTTIQSTSTAQADSICSELVAGPSGPQGQFLIEDSARIPLHRYLQSSRNGYVTSSASANGRTTA